MGSSHTFPRLPTQSREPGPIGMLGRDVLELLCHLLFSFGLKVQHEG